MPKAKKFLDRKNAVTFHLVHRSQKDPLAADETAPQHVLVEAPADKQNKEPVIKRKEEQRKWGVFYDDEYDYMQHLRDAKDISIHWAPAQDPSKPLPVKAPKEKNPTRLTLPSSVFASEVEEDVGLLNKAAPQSGLRLDLDPDVVAAMDEDFNFDDPDNQLEDNFMELAMKEGPEGEDGSDEEYTDDDDEDSQRGYGSDGRWVDSDDSGNEQRQRAMPFRRQADDDDNKSRFSQYSMSSSVMRRSNGLTLLDDRFEKMFAEYDDTEIGALDCEDIEGHLQATPEVLLQCAEHFHDQRKTFKLDRDKEANKITRLQEISEEGDVKDEDLFGADEEVKEEWDCESILSTYSNLYNHPKIIEEPNRNKKIKISSKTGIPLGVLEGSEDTAPLTVKSLARLNIQQAGRNSSDDEESVCESVMSTLSILSLRPKDETPEEKKERKRLLKEYRNERRIEKKTNTQAFKDEKKLQEKISINNRKNIQGIKIV